MRQYYDIKRQHPDSLVLFRMGDFFETFDEDARVASRILGITLTKRANGAAAEVPLAGFPHHALDTYLPKLIESGLRVAICEQVEDPKKAKGIVKREVVEVVTPGTALLEEHRTRKTNNFLGAIKHGKERVGYAFLDHSTGEFYLGESSEAQLMENLLKFSPREIILQEGSRIEDMEWFGKVRPFVTEMDEWAFDPQVCRTALMEHFGVTSLRGFGCEDHLLGIAAAGVILRYVEHNIHSRLDHVTKLTLIRDGEEMGLDDFTIRNLELFSSLSTQGTHGTLISILDRTVTAGGGRLLRHRLLRPLTDRRRIEKRLAYVESFLTHNQLRHQVRRILANCTDLERVVGKLSRGRSTPREVAGLKNTLGLIPELQAALTKPGNKVLHTLGRMFRDTTVIVEKIDRALVDSPPVSITEGGVFRDGVDQELDELRKIAKGGKNWIASLEKSEKKRTGIPSLKVGYNKVFGYYLEVTRSHLEKVPDSYIRKQTLVNAERFVTPALKDYEEKILNAEEKVLEIETRLFQELRSWVLGHSTEIQHNAGILNQLDLHASLAEVAAAYKYSKPRLVDEALISLKDSRHPVVESLLPAGEKFVPNDLRIDVHQDQILLVTGPNMAGKSTFLRQVGLIVLMAQMGSFVPAREATIGIADRLFTRVGASDNLAGGESTFMVEMTEAANILNNATPKSLVIFDEIGRGTATFDGLSLAWAITEFLHETTDAKARTIFATHYHELTQLEDLLQGVKNCNVSVKEFGDRIVFLRKIVPGPCDKSYGIHVAQMAGLPRSVIGRATEILNQLIEHKPAKGDRSVRAMKSPGQLDLFATHELELREALAELDVDRMTPLEALTKLDELKSKYGS